jgi:hypothetical protein
VDSVAAVIAYNFENNQSKGRFSTLGHEPAARLVVWQRAKAFSDAIPATVPSSGDGNPMHEH